MCMTKQLSPSTDRVHDTRSNSYCLPLMTISGFIRESFWQFLLWEHVGVVTGGLQSLTRCQLLLLPCRSSQELEEVSLQILQFVAWLPHQHIDPGAPRTKGS